MKSNDPSFCLGCILRKFNLQCHPVMTLNEAQGTDIHSVVQFTIYSCFEMALQPFMKPCRWNQSKSPIPDSIYKGALGILYSFGHFIRLDCESEHVITYNHMCVWHNDRQVFNVKIETSQVFLRKSYRINNINATCENPQVWGANFC